MCFFGSLILEGIKWKSKASTSANFMNYILGDMIKTQDEVIGKPVEDGIIFSIPNARGRKALSRCSKKEIRNFPDGDLISF